MASACRCSAEFLKPLAPHADRKGGDAQRGCSGQLHRLRGRPWGVSVVCLSPVLRSARGDRRQLRLSAGLRASERPREGPLLHRFVGARSEVELAGHDPVLHDGTDFWRLQQLEEAFSSSPAPESSGSSGTMLCGMVLWPSWPRTWARRPARSSVG